LVKDFDTELLGQLPLHKDIRLQSDEGQPIVAALEGGAIAQSYQRAATSLIAALQQQPKDFSASFGKIDVQINTAE
jgi:ATP-binding protein involved in chromosome partitioning